MNNEIKKILDMIISSGFCAYIVGGYVRDYYMHIDSNDVDIATDALPKDLKDIFKDMEVKISSYGSLKLSYDKYNFDITTFRKDIKYTNNKLIQLEYVNNIDDDILRRDFTINALYMDINGQIIDKVNGIKDIDNKIIRLIGNKKKKLEQDSSRVLRALRFMINLDFKLDKEFLEYILNNKNLLEFNNNILKEELDKMLISPHVVDYFNYFKYNQLLDILKVDYTTLTYVEDINGMYAQLIIKEELPFTKEQKDSIRDIKKIINYGTIDYGVLFNHDLYICLVAGKILGIDKKEINLMYSNMPIKSVKNLEINGDEIQELLNVKPSKMIKEIIDCLVFLVLNKDLKNENDILKKYVLDNKEQWMNEF